VPELQRVHAVEHGVLDLDLPHVLGVRRQYVDELHRLQPDAHQVLQLLVHRHREVVGDLDRVTVELVVNDDRLLRRAEEAHLERLVGRALHGGHD